MIIILMLIALFNITHLISSESTSAQEGFIDNGISIFLEVGEYYSLDAPLATENDTVNAPVFSTFITHVGEEKYPIITTSQMYYLLLSARMFAEVAQGEKGIAVLKDLHNKYNQYYSKTFDITQYEQPTKLFSKIVNLIKLQEEKSAQLSKAFEETPILLLIIAAYYNFKPDNWTIKDLGAGMILMVPEKNVTANAQKGLALQTLNNLSFADAKNNLDFELNAASILSAIQQAFIPQKQFGTNWGIFLFSHGTPEGNLSLITTDQLFSLIFDLTKRIQLRILAVQACYIGGKIAKDITEVLYKELLITEKKVTSFSTIIALGSIYSSVTKTTRIDPINVIDFFSQEYPLNLKRLRINVAAIKVSSFFDSLKTQSVIDFEESLNYIFQFKIENEFLWESFFPTNIPILKFPEAEGFKVINARNNIVSLGKNLIQSRNPKKPLNLRTFQGTKFFGAKQDGTRKEELIDPKVILLYDNYIPFPLQFLKINDTDTFPEFIYMPHEEKKIITIEELQAYGFTLQEVIKGFSSTIESVPTVFYIKNLILDKDSMSTPITSMLFLNINTAFLLRTLSKKNAAHGIFTLINNEWKYEVYDKNMQNILETKNFKTKGLDRILLKALETIDFPSVALIEAPRAKPAEKIEPTLMLQQLKQPFFNFNEDMILAGQALRK